MGSVNDYKEMWQNLGLDLNNHDMLLDAVSNAYSKTFLNQKNRPQSMDYFNFVMQEVHGLRVKELVDSKKNGHKVIGSFCVFVPEEIVRATGSTLVGLCTGADFMTEKVEEILPRNLCALIKSAFGFKLGKVCPYMEVCDMIVGENTCDGKKKAYETLNNLVPHLHIIDLPQMKSEEGRKLLKSEYIKFMKVVEKLTGCSINADNLKRGIEIVNEKRRAIERLNNLRSAQYVPISGLDALLINQVYFYDDPVRFTNSVNKLCDELEARIKNKNSVKNNNFKRIIMSGCPMALPNWKLPSIIEANNAVIVGEESCVGARGIRNYVDSSRQTLDELIDAIVDRYLKIECAIFTPNEERINHIKEMYEKFHADGVIHYSLQFCHPYTIESYGVEKTLESEGIPTLRLETDYSNEDLGQLKTRIEAFLERLD
jgi:benzoyl-CoA reductase/2-hydroxyglutaryl-CoA dehydratase subunit BcrC/BadD/HgdB